MEAGGQQMETGAGNTPRLILKALFSLNSLFLRQRKRACMNMLHRGQTSE
jgi:hypothetical protein